MTSTDPEMRGRLSRAVDPVRFEVESHLRAVHRRSAALQRRRRLVTVGLAVAVAAAGIAAAGLLLPLRPAQDDVAGGGSQGRIASTRVTMTDGELDYDAYAASSEGSEVRQILSEPEITYAPVWSPDGSRIAFFSSDPDGASAEIWVTEADGAGAHPLADVPRPEANAAPAWSPNGDLIAYVGAEEGRDLSNPYG